MKIVSSNFALLQYTKHDMFFPLTGKLKTPVRFRVLHNRLEDFLSLFIVPGTYYSLDLSSLRSNYCNVHGGSRSERQNEMAEKAITIGPKSPLPLSPRSGVSPIFIRQGPPFFGALVHSYLGALVSTYGLARSL